MDVSKMSETELKALFYDELTKMERAKLNMDAINQELNLRKSKEDPKKDKP